MRDEKRATGRPVFALIWTALHVIGFFVLFYGNENLKSSTAGMKGVLLLLFLFSEFYGIFGRELITALRERLPVLTEVLEGLTLFLSPLYMLLLFDLSWTPALFQIRGIHLLVEYLLCGLLLAFFMLLSPVPRYGIYAAYTISFMFGLGNTLVLQFRNDPVAPVDLLSLRTAAAVAGGYVPDYTLQVLLTFLLTLSGIAWAGSIVRLQRSEEEEGLGTIDRDRSVWRSENRALKRVGAYRRKQGKPEGEKRAFSLKGYLLRLGIAVLLMFSAVLWVVKVDFEKAYQVPYAVWTPLYSYEICGFPLAFTAQLHMMLPDKPEGYSAEDTEAYIKEAEGTVETAKIKDRSSFQNPNPVVLTIMNESFTDFGRTGDFPDSERYQKFYHTLEKDPGTIEYGNAYSSTRGGGTYKSEFEYLTGCTMYYVRGTIPYVMFDFTEIPSVVKSYRAEGYTTVAAHPFLPGDWSRDKVYAGMTFDTFLDISDFDTEGKTDYRGYLSDAGDYERLLEEINAHEEPLFLFNVTMQNHGGYLPEKMPEVAVPLRAPYDAYGDAGVFTGMMRESDEALEMLLSELKKLDRPVLLTFFGDHQPSLDPDFEELLFESERDTAESEEEYLQRRFVTPYVIWANYEVEADAGFSQTAAGSEAVSLNYLGVMTRYYAGCTLTPYEAYLMNLRRTVPLITVNGIYSKETGFSDGALTGVSEAEKEALYRYHCIEYRGIYDP